VTLHDSTCGCCNHGGRSRIGVTAGVRKAERFPVSRKRKPGQPAHRKIGDFRLTKNEKEYRDACLLAWSNIPFHTIVRLFAQPYDRLAENQIKSSLEGVQEFFQELTLFQVDESATKIFNEIRNEVAADWATLEKADTPSEFAASMQFNRASPAATTYASMSAANMVTDMVDSQIVAVRGVVTQAFSDGLGRGAVQSKLVTILNDMPSPRGVQAGVGGLTQMFGTATRGLTPRYATAVYRRAEKIAAANPGMSPANLQKRVESYGRRLRLSRARTISRTEIMRASNQGRLQGMIQAADRGLVNPSTAKKQWVTSRFDVCPICVPLNGTTVGIRESFGPPGQAPPAHPNCRCTIRMLPDPLTFGIPRSTGTGETDTPLRFVRPERPGLSIEDLVSGPGTVAEPGALVGQPGARIADDVPTEVSEIGLGKGMPVPDEILDEVNNSAHNYVVDGKFTPEREALHDKIINEILDGVPVSEDPTFYFMGGGTASGKSSFLRANGIPGLREGRYAHIDPDDIKRLLPETDILIELGDEGWVGYTHEESSYLAKRLLKASSERRIDHLLDGTGNSTVGSVANKIKQAREAGYKIEAQYVSIPYEEAVAREASRAARTGRKVPDQIIRSTHAGVSNTLPKVTDLFDELYLYNNETGPELIFRSLAGKDEIIDAGRYREFLAKADL
jgi:predicted ABC-type ATPase